MRPASLVRCVFVTENLDYFHLIAKKIGPDVRLQQHSALSPTPVATAAAMFQLRSEEDLERLQPLFETVCRHSSVIAVIPAHDPRISTAAIENGAFACWSEGGSMDELRALLRRAHEFQSLKGISSGTPVAKSDPHTLIGDRIGSLVATAVRLSKSDVNVLITGESGTGKEAFARLLHTAGQRAALPFIAVACSSLPESLIEAELFGHEKGAFTGACAQRRGRFEEVGAGTLFLDEIAELSPMIQVKLLRVLQERTFERLGSSRSIACPARIVFATNQDLRELVRIGKFRLDLFYRLNAVQLELTPLRERCQDIPLLARTFLARSAERDGRSAPVLSERAVAALQQYAWPGNVRELQNAMEAVIALHDADVIEPYHLPASMISVSRDPEWVLSGGTFDQEVRRFKRKLIERTLLESHNNKQLAARSLGIARSSLHRLIDELEISSESVSAGSRLAS